MHSYSHEHSNVGPSAFNGWMYSLTFPSNSITTMDTEYQYDNLLPNAVDIIDILPSVPGEVGNIDNTLMSSWIVQTVDNGQCVLVVILYQ